jgi:hypothetical protein
MGRFSRFKSRHGKQVENDGGGRGNGEDRERDGGEGDGSPSAYLNLSNWFNLYYKC